MTDMANDYQPWKPVRRFQQPCPSARWDDQSDSIPCSRLRESLQVLCHVRMRNLAEVARGGGLLRVYVRNEGCSVAACVLCAPAKRATSSASSTGLAAFSKLHFPLATICVQDRVAVLCLSNAQPWHVLLPFGCLNPNSDGLLVALAK